MPVDTEHLQYKWYLPIWKKCRDVCSGADKVKAEGETYLPALSAQPSEEYKKYLDRAMFYAASERTIGGLLGSIFRRPPVIDPDPAPSQMEIVGVDGQSIELLAMGVVLEVLITGRLGMLVDSDPSLGSQVSIPYVAMYPAESIINWSSHYDGQRTLLDMVVLKEHYVKEREDRFELKSGVQYRVLYIENGVVAGEVWRKPQDSSDWALHEAYVPEAAGRKLSEIPFKFLNGFDNTTAIHNPIISPVVDVNLSHYKSSADLENGRHICGIPTPYLAGFQVDGDTFRLGAETGYVSRDPQATGGFIEFSGSGLTFLENALREKEALMAVLGARLLEQQKKGVEAAETIRLRQIGENSALSQIAKSCSSGINETLAELARWRKSPKAPTVELNTDFVSDRMSPQEMKELVYTWQSGGVSWQTLFHNLKKGEVIPATRTEEEEQELIQSSLPVMGEGS